MKTVLLAITVLAFGQSAFAGEGGTQVVCKSGTGKTKIEVYTSDGGSAEMTVSLKNGEKFISQMYANKNTELNYQYNDSNLQKTFPGVKVRPIVSIVRKDVIAYIVADTEGYDSVAIELISVPGTVEMKRGEYGGVKAKFQAILSGKDPRKSDGGYLENQVQVACTYDYSI